jgi:hypothetical protein
LSLAKEAVDIMRATVNPDSADLAIAYNSLAITHARIGNLPAAITCMDDAVAIMTRALGEEHPSTVMVKGSRAKMAAELEQQGRAAIK